MFGRGDPRGFPRGGGNNFSEFYIRTEGGGYDLMFGRGGPRGFHRGGGGHFNEFFTDTGGGRGPMFGR